MKCNKQICKPLLILVLITIPVISNAALVVLDSTTINFSASGSPNTIVGGWGASPLIIPYGTTINYYSFELNSFQATNGWGLSQTIQLGNTTGQRFDLCNNSSVCPAPPQLGTVFTVTDGVGRAFLDSLVEGSSTQSNGGVAGLWWSSGGYQMSASGSILINAFGETSSAVPLPTAAWLLSSGLFGLFTFIHRRRA